MNKKACAAFTITRNEPLFLSAWCNYYCGALPEEDVYVIDNSSTDDSVTRVQLQHPNINVVTRPSEKTHQTLWLKHVVEGFQRKLLDLYDVVVFAETDEFLIPSNRYSGLRDYCDKLRASDRPWARATGWNVVHQVDSEAPLRASPGSRLLEDRRSMWRISIYDKTIITKVPLTYQKGFHNFYVGGTKQVNEPLDPDLDLFHAWCIDVDVFHQRHGSRLGLNEAGARSFFRKMDAVTNSFGDPFAEGDRKPVPAHWIDLIRV